MILGHALRWIVRALVIAVTLVVVTWPLFWPQSEARGVWRTDGYGMILDVGRFRIDGYQTTDVSCLKFMSAPAHSFALSELADAGLLPSDGRLSVAVEGTVNLIEADKIAALPEACANGGTPTRPGTARENFDVLWHAMNENYAFFDLHGVDWQARYGAAPDGSLDDEALWTLLTDTLAGLDDGHTYLVDRANNLGFSPAIGPDWAENLVEFREVPRQLGLQGIDDTGLEYTILDGNIGYVFLRHMATRPGIATSEATLAASAFESIADALADVDAIILDNRLNPGGSDTVSLAYAGFFAPEDYDAFTKQTRNAQGYTAPVAGRVIARNRLDQPVYLLNSRATASAAEIFTLAMKELPQVTILGEPTSGGFSDIMEVTLPNGWLLGLSHQVYRDMDGEDYEGRGIAPDIPAPFDAAAFSQGNDPLLAEVLEMAKTR